MFLFADIQPVEIKLVFFLTAVSVSLRGMVKWNFGD